MNNITEIIVTQATDGQDNIKDNTNMRTVIGLEIKIKKKIYK